MANITKRGNSYSIRVSAGYDASGKQIMKSMTWKIPEGMSEKKAEKEAQKVATLFEEKVRTGQIADEKSMKFSAYAEKWFSDYAATQLRPRTIDGYKHLMIRIEPALGHLYIDKIRPAHLVKFYSDLSSTPKECTYKCTVDLKALLKESGKSLTAFSSENNISLPALKSAANGRNLSPENAIQIAKVLKKSLADLFEISGGGETLSASTVGKYHRVLSSMFETAVKWGLIVSNPCERVSPPKDRKSKKNEAQFLTAEQAKEMISLLDNEPEKYRNATILLLFTGMRRGEMLGLEWDDLNLEKGTLRINKTIQYLPDRGIFEDDTIKAGAAAYAENPAGWLLMCGQSGSGKTHLCTAVCRHRLLAGDEVRYMPWREKISEIKGLSLDNGKRAEILQGFKSAQILYIDDFYKTGKAADGSSNPTGADIGIAFEIINHRYINHLPTIISTEKTPQDLVEIDEATGSRIIEMAGNNVYEISKDPKRNYRLRGVVTV